MSARARLGVLVSGRGSNMVALAQACTDGAVDAEVALVVSNLPGAPALARAAERGIPTAVFDHRGASREAHDARMIGALEQADVSTICLAGYLRLLSPAFVRRYEGRILNVHPSLLPAFPGLDAQAQALAHGVKITGCTVHLVDEQLDHGPILAQYAVPVLDDDTVETLSLRILEAEHRTYPKALAAFLSGPLRSDSRGVQSQP
jgi:phosphoribosylglycinamide formyltransferase-1